MSRTISQLSAGTLIYIDETISGNTVHTPYIYLGLDDNGNACVLRQYAAIKKRMHSSNVASYNGCEADLWLEDTSAGFLSRFDAATINALVNTTIKYVDYNQSGDGTAQVLSIARRCFLLSYSEEGYGNDAAGNEGSSFLPALQTFTGKTGSAARITYDETDTAVSAWVRSARSAENFRNVGTGGSASNGSATSAVNWLRPALSVAAATLVSDEGADSIFLLPDGRITTWNIDATVSLGETQNRPSKCKLLVPHGNFATLTLQVCNNYGDAAPTWVNCADGGVAEFGTTKTGESWELGVKIHAEANVPGEAIGEPAMIVEFAS